MARKQEKAKMLIGKKKERGRKWKEKKKSLDVEQKTRYGQVNETEKLRPDQ